MRLHLSHGPNGDAPKKGTIVPSVQIEDLSLVERREVKVLAQCMARYGMIWMTPSANEYRMDTGSAFVNDDSLNDLTSKATQAISV